jgi:hypothetical protein
MASDGMLSVAEAVARPRALLTCRLPLIPLPPGGSEPGRLVRGKLRTMLDQGLPWADVPPLGDILPFQLARVLVERRSVAEPDLERVRGAARALVDWLLPRDREHRDRFGLLWSARDGALVLEVRSVRVASRSAQETLVEIEALGSAGMTIDNKPRASPFGKGSRAVENGARDKVRWDKRLAAVERRLDAVARLPAELNLVGVSGDLERAVAFAEKHGPWTGDEHPALIEQRTSGEAKAWLENCPHFREAGPEHVVAWLEAVNALLPRPVEDPPFPDVAAQLMRSLPRYLVGSWCVQAAREAVVVEGDRLPHWTTVEALLRPKERALVWLRDLVGRVAAFHDREPVKPASDEERRKVLQAFREKQRLAGVLGSGRLNGIGVRRWGPPNFLNQSQRDFARDGGQPGELVPLARQETRRSGEIQESEPAEN